MLNPQLVLRANLATISAEQVDLSADSFFIILCLVNCLVAIKLITVVSEMFELKSKKIIKYYEVFSS